MVNIKLWDKISSGFFFAGFIIAKLHHFPIPIPAINVILTLASMSLYLAGYAVWAYTARHYPPHRRPHENWYGFAQLKTQYFLSALLGVIGAGLLIGAVFCPIAAIPGLWFFAVSNILWHIAETHKYHHPPANDITYSSMRQNKYMGFASLVTVISLLSALGGTLSILFPPLSIAFLGFSMLISISLGIAAGCIWFDAFCTRYPSDHDLNKSVPAVKRDNEPDYEWIELEKKTFDPAVRSTYSTQPFFVAAEESYLYFPELENSPRI